MDINITTPALLFPAITLLLLAYTQRFLSLASIIRTLNEKLSKSDTDKQSLIKQIENLHIRVSLIKFMQACGVSSILCCIITMALLFSNLELVAKIVFGISLALMVLSLLLSLWEILLSGNALKIELETIRKSRNC